MKKLITFFAFALMAICSSISIDAQSSRGGWQEVNYDVTTPSITDPRQADGIEIFLKDGTVIIRTPRRIQVKVFTILGQLISQDFINTGTSELKISYRGIYIIKIGTLTQKVAL